MHTEKDYQEMIEYLVAGDQGWIEDDEWNHSFVYSSEGDGWNEPLSDTSSCHCGWDGLQWVQTDPEMTGRYAIWEHVFMWTRHVRTLRGW